jgi:predicted small lipoprotein YifL
MRGFALFVEGIMRHLLLIALLLVVACGTKKPPLVPDDPNAPQPQLEVDGGSEEAGW